MRKLPALIVALLSLAITGAATASPTFVFRGHGWGHAIGMAQYGAEGYARDGWTYDQILAHYYGGTQLGPAPTSKIRVLLGEARSAAVIGSDARFTVTDANGVVLQLPAGALTLGPDLVVEGTQLSPPVRIRPHGKPLTLGKPYRGTFTITVGKGGLTIVNAVSLEKYLYGVVPGEMPAEWQPEALKVQAVAARSYALASRKTGGSFDVYADTRSQVYGGVLVEDPRSSAAVDATKGQVVLYDGEVAWTFFSASSGGRTAAIEEVWQGSEPVPYLVSVDDPFDTISPYHDWGPLTFTAEQLQAKLGAKAPPGLKDVQLAFTPTGRVATVTLIGDAGQTQVTGSAFRTLVGLRSTWFALDSMSIEPSARRIVYGDSVVLSGAVGGASSVTVEHRPSGADWKRLRTLDTARDGSFTTEHRPARTTDYRVRGGGKLGPPVRVLVAPSLTLRKADGGQGVTGRVDPGIPGVEVVVQRKSGGAWIEVGRASAGDGVFAVSIELEPGVYRAIIPATGALARGVSKPLQVTSA